MLKWFDRALLITLLVAIIFTYAKIGIYSTDVLYNKKGLKTQNKILKDVISDEIKQDFKTKFELHWKERNGSNLYRN